MSDDDLVSSDDNDDYDDNFFDCEISQSGSVLSSDDDDVQLSTLAFSNVTFEWSKYASKLVKWESPAEATDIPEKTLLLNPAVDPERSITKDSSPIAFYNLFITKDIWENTVFQTELYNNWRSVNPGSRKVRQVFPEEIGLMIGAILFMGIVKLPTRCMYWQEETRVSLISESITENRFSEIISMIHFNDNSIIDCNETNRIFKIQTLVDALKHNFRSTVLPETCMAVDEQMIPSKGRSGLRRYLPKKPKKWGYKLWASAGVSDYVYNFEVDGSLESK